MTDLEPFVLNLKPIELLKRFDSVGRVLVVYEAVAIAVAGPVVGYLKDICNNYLFIIQYCSLVIF